MFIRLKCCRVSTSWWSCSTIEPLGPVVSELRSLTAGMPAWVVDPVACGVDSVIAYSLMGLGWVGEPVTQMGSRSSGGAYTGAAVAPARWAEQSEHTPW